MRNSLSDARPFSKIIFALFIILGTFLVTFFIGFLISIPIFHININELNDVLTNYQNPDNIRFLKFLQTLQGIGLFIVPAFIIAYLFHNKPKKYLGLISTNSRLIILSGIILLASIPLINSFAVFNQNMQLPDWLGGVESWMKEKELNAQDLTLAFLKMDNVRSLLFNVFMIGILPAIGEELIFRGVLQRLFTEWTKNVHWGIAIAAILFSAMHMQFYGFLPRMILGIILGYLFYWNGSIWIPIVGHFVNNTAAILAYYFYSDSVGTNIENMGIGEGSIQYFIIGLALVVPLMYLFYKESQNSLKIKDS